MTVSDVALPHGTNGQPVDVAQAHTRTRASIAVTNSEIKTARETPAWARRAGAVAVSAWTVTRQDVVGAWPWRSRAPALRDHWAAAPRREHVPGGNTAAWRVWQVWHYGPATAAIAVLSIAMWLMQHPLRAIPAGAILIALLLMWI